MKIFFLIGVALLTAACGDSITPKITTKFDARRTQSGAIAFSVSVKNERDSPTVPIVVEVDAGGKPVIHPAAFALNRNESHTITGSLDTKAAVTAQLTIKEAERGKMVATVAKQIAAAE